MVNTWTKFLWVQFVIVETSLNDMKMLKTLRFMVTQDMNMPILLMNSKAQLIGTKPKLILQSLTLKSAQRMAFLTHTKQMSQSQRLP